MRSLTLRIFVSFWLVIGLLVALAAAAGYAYSERLREAYANFDESDDTVAAASAALQAGGRDGLVEWLRTLDSASPVEVLIVDANGDDLLGRPIPFIVERMLRRFSRHQRRPHRREREWRGEDGPNIRPARPITRLISATGERYSFFVTPKRNPYREWIAERAAPSFLLLALAISGAVSFALARAIARPVKTFREATLAIADGNFATRVSPTMRNRGDEIGLLAHDLDAMAAKLERASEQQTELTRNVSHELRSPLARLRVALELARRRAGDLTEFARIDAEIERLDTMIGQLLSFSRLTSDAPQSRERVDLRALLDEAVANANYECRSSGIDGVDVTLSGPGSVPFVAEPGILTGAFDNVLRNAIKHSPAGTTVNVRLSESGNGVRIEVEDRGEGVPQSELERIFDPFYRSERHRQNDQTGTGLGLAIARRAVAQHGGKIAAERGEAGGLKISITLPSSGV